MISRDSLALFIGRCRDENGLLARNGASEAAKGRESLLDDLEAALDGAEERLISVKEAVKLSGAHCDTIRRAVRTGQIEDLRSVPNGSIRIRESDLELLKGKTRKKRNASKGGYDMSEHLAATLGRKNGP